MFGIVTKNMFFDSQKVMNATDRATRRVLSKFGAFVRRGAKSSIGKRKRVSDPGQPPSSHTGLLKKLILFGYDASRQSVVIGPMKLSGRENKDAPEVAEYGGTAKRIFTIRKKRTVKNVKYKARPFMRPALEREEPKLPAMWADSVK